MNYQFEEDQDGFDHAHACYECGDDWSSADCENNYCALGATERATCPACRLHEQFYEVEMERHDYQGGEE